mmetsp:Transcript_3865/g.7783  ORF Transcript_3865/g.7783 Transcript_3865/m.7783 type:complete len:109 (-) Transcript_3865:35-361(-)
MGVISPLISSPSSLCLVLSWLIPPATSSVDIDSSFARTDRDVDRVNDDDAIDEMIEVFVDDIMGDDIIPLVLDVTVILWLFTPYEGIKVNDDSVSMRVKKHNNRIMVR